MGIKPNQTDNKIKHYTNSNLFFSFRRFIFHSETGGAGSNKKVPDPRSEVPEHVPACSSSNEALVRGAIELCV